MAARSPAAKWRDYALDFLRDRALFSIYKRASERPFYVVEKNPKLRNKQGQYMVIGQDGPRPEARPRAHERPARARARRRQMILVRPATEADVRGDERHADRLDHRALLSPTIATIPRPSPAGLPTRHRPASLPCSNAPGNQLLVAERDGEIAAVGCVMGGNEIGLNYVHPAHRFKGVSRALLTAMEDVMRQAGTTEGRLKATTTAHQFYLDAGWIDTGPVYTGRWIDAYPMTKQL